VQGNRTLTQGGTLEVRPSEKREKPIRRILSGYVHLLVLYAYLAGVIILHYRATSCIIFFANSQVGFAPICEDEEPMLRTGLRGLRFVSSMPMRKAKELAYIEERT
jgi:hypothetical protein